MKNYSIVHLDMAHLEEICQDIKTQFESGVTNMPLFSMSLVAEGSPAIDKATLFCEKFDKFRQRLSELGVPCGILVQSSLGHGPKLNALPPFQRYVALDSGEEHYKCCPESEGVREHFKNQLAIIASHNPDEIMIDDDVRILSNAGGGCACPAHLKKMGEILGREISREELFELVKTNKEIKDKYVALMGESLLGYARALREGIDSVNPSIPGSYCGVGINFEHAEDIAAIMAGKGNPVVVRVNNAKYAAPGPRGLSDVMYKAATHIAKVRHVADCILAESDTCPHNRYSTAASTLHTQFTASLLEGCSGAKHWLSRSTFEPESGIAYRKILSENLKFYEAITTFAKDLKWIGCRIPVSKNRLYDYTQYFLNLKNNWASNVLERLGIPIYFSADEGGVVFLEQDVDSMFSDEEILSMLADHVYLSSDAAQHLIDRGFKEYIGVEIREWKGETMSGEFMPAYGTRLSTNCENREIVPLSDDVRIDSQIYHLRNGKEFVNLFPGVVTYKNKLGGIVHTFSGVPIAANHYTKFSLLNQSRKRQFISLIQEKEALPVYYGGDSEILLKAAYTPENELFVAYFNISLDCSEKIELVLPKEAKKVEILTSDGVRQECSFNWKDGILTVNKPSIVQMPTLMFITQ